MLAFKRSTILATLGLAILVVLALFVWPTVYRYDHMKLDTYDYPVRINRLTGKAEVLFPNGWHAPTQQSQPAAKPQQLPSEDIAKLEGQPEMTNYGWLEFHVYNGSNWNISEITVLVEVFDANKAQKISRPYRMTGSVTPQGSSKFIAELGFTLTPGQTWTYSIVSAEGAPL